MRVGEFNVQEPRLATPPHEIMLELERAFVSMDDGANVFVGHRRDAVFDSQLFAEVARHHRQAFTARQPARTLDMGSQVTIAKIEPRRPA